MEVSNMSQPHSAVQARSYAEDVEKQPETTKKEQGVKGVVSKPEKSSGGGRIQPGHLVRHR